MSQPASRAALRAELERLGPDRLPVGDDESLASYIEGAVGFYLDGLSVSLDLRRGGEFVLVTRGTRVDRTDRGVWREAGGTVTLRGLTFEGTGPGKLPPVVFFVCGHRLEQRRGLERLILEPVS